MFQCLIDRGLRTFFENQAVNWYHSESLNVIICYHIYHIGGEKMSHVRAELGPFPPERSGIPAKEIEPHHHGPDVDTWSQKLLETIENPDENPWKAY